MKSDELTNNVYASVSNSSSQAQIEADAHHAHVPLYSLPFLSTLHYPVNNITHGSAAKESPPNASGESSSTHVRHCSGESSIGSTSSFGSSASMFDYQSHLTSFTYSPDRSASAPAPVLHPFLGPTGAEYSYQSLVSLSDQHNLHNGSEVNHKGMSNPTVMQKVTENSSHKVSSDPPLPKAVRKHSKKCHIKKFKCDTCNKMFSKKCNLIHHRRLHTGENMHECKDCTKKFSRLDHLKRHSVVHTGEKQFACVICEKRFTQKCDMKRHLLIHSKWLFMCYFCCLLLNLTFIWTLLRLYKIYVQYHWIKYGRG